MAHDASAITSTPAPQPQQSAISSQPSAKTQPSAASSHPSAKTPPSALSDQPSANSKIDLTIDARGASADQLQNAAPVIAKNAAKAIGAPTSAGEFRELDLALIIPSKTNPRKNFEGPAMDDLVASIRTNGVIQAITVRKRPGTDPALRDEKGDAFEIVAGERRWRAAKAAELKTIPARIMELSDCQALEIRVIENEQREDTTPLEQARGYRGLLDAMAKEQSKVSRTALVQQLAKQIGKSERHVWMCLKLIDLAPEVSKALDEGKITVSHAHELVRLQPSDQKKALALASAQRWTGEKTEKVPVSIREFKSAVDREYRTDLASAPWKLDDANLLPTAGACATCKKNSAIEPGADEKKRTCSDPGCFQQKREKFIELRVAAVAEKEALGAGQILKLQGEGDYEQREGMLQLYKWRYSIVERNACPSTRTGMVVSGKDLGKVEHVCLDDKCKKHHPESAKRTNTCTDEKKAREKAAAEQKFRVALFKATADKIKAWTRADIEWLIGEAAEAIPEIAGDALAAVFGNVEFYDLASPKSLGNMTEAELARMIFMLRLAEELHVCTYDTSKPQKLLEAAKRLGINSEKIRAAVKTSAVEGSVPKEPKPAKQAKAKPKPAAKRSAMPKAALARLRAAIKKSAKKAGRK